MLTQVEELISPSHREPQPKQTSGTSFVKLNPLLKDFTAGAIAGAAAIVTTQPLDTVRIRLQQAGVSAASSTGPVAPRAAAPGAFSILRNTVRHEGVLALWKGMAVPLVMASVQSAILFQVYGLTLRLINPAEAARAKSGHAHDDGRASSHAQASTSGSAQQVATQSTANSIPSATEGFIAGCAAGLGQVWVWSPVEMVKLRMQLQKVPRGSPGYVGPLALARRIWQREGVRGLYRGITATALRDVPSFGIYFGLYHVFVEALEGHKHPDDASPLTHIIAGGTAGAISWLPVYPVDVIKTRMQATSYQQTQGMTWLDFGKQVVKQESARGLYRGLPTTLARAFLCDAVAFAVYRLSLKGMADM